MSSNAEKMFQLLLECEKEEQAWAINFFYEAWGTMLQLELEASLSK